MARLWAAIVGISLTLTVTSVEANESFAEKVPHVLIAVNKTIQSALAVSSRFASYETCEKARKWWLENAGPGHYTRSECFPE